MPTPDLGNERLSDIPSVQNVVGKIVTKVCTRCEEEKSLDQYGNHSKTRDGKQSWCRACSADHARLKREATDNRYNREYSKARHKAVQKLIERHTQEFEILLEAERKRGKAKKR